MAILICILAIIASELVFDIGFIPIYIIVRLLHLIYAVLHLKNKYRWMVDGILVGSSLIFVCCCISLLITRNQKFSELEIILLSVILPLISEFGYLKCLATGKPYPIWLRLRGAAKAIAQRAEFEVNLASLQQEYLLTHTAEELKEERNAHLLGKEAYDRAQGGLFYFFLWSLLGYTIGIILFHYVFFS